MKSFLLVAAGGAFGTLARHGVSDWLDGDRLFPLATFTVNITGSFLLGLLLAALTVTGPHAATHRDLRLALGTGFLGGFTTYSTFAVESETLLRGEHAEIALLYALGSCLLGVLAAIAGAITARAVTR